MKNICMVSSPFCEKWKAGGEDPQHQGICTILFYVLLKSRVENILETTISRVFLPHIYRTFHGNGCEAQSDDSFRISLDILIMFKCDFS